MVDDLFQIILFQVRILHLVEVVHYDDTCIYNDAGIYTPEISRCRIALSNRLTWEDVDSCRSLVGVLLSSVSSSWWFSQDCISNITRDSLC